MAMNRLSRARKESTFPFHVDGGCGSGGCELVAMVFSLILRSGFGGAKRDGRNDGGGLAELVDVVVVASVASFPVGTGMMASSFVDSIAWGYESFAIPGFRVVPSISLDITAASRYR